MTMLLALGSALPFIIAWVLIASTNDDNPLNRIPDYDDPITETLALPLGGDAAVATEFEYRGDVRVIVEGTATLTGEARRDAFYAFTGTDGAPLAAPQRRDSLFTIAGEPALAALGLSATPPDYTDDHIYTGLYHAGRDWTHITFGTAPGTPDVTGGTLQITVVQIE